MLAHFLFTESTAFESEPFWSFPSNRYTNNLVRLDRLECFRRNAAASERSYERSLEINEKDYPRAPSSIGGTIWSFSGPKNDSALPFGASLGGGRAGGGVNSGGSSSSSCEKPLQESCRRHQNTGGPFTPDVKARGPERCDQTLACDDKSPWRYFAPSMMAR